MSADGGVILVGGEALFDVVAGDTEALEAHPGGAAFNAVRTIARLEQPAAYLGRLSTDRFGQRLERVLGEDGVSLEAVVAPTTRRRSRWRSWKTAGASRGTVLQPGHVGAGADVGGRAQRAARQGRDAVRRHARPRARADGERVRGRRGPAVGRGHAGRGRPEHPPGVIPTPRPTAAAAAGRSSAPRREGLRGGHRWLDPAGRRSRRRGRCSPGPASGCSRAARRRVVVTRDARGRRPPPRAKVVDTIGAGDAFAGGFLAWWRERGLRRGRPGPTWTPSSPPPTSPAGSPRRPASAPAHRPLPSRAVTMEIERKYLVPQAPDDVDTHPSTVVEQGYLAIHDDGTEVRIRRRDGASTMTVKSSGGRTRAEEELELDDATFERLWPLTEGRRIEKVRHVIHLHARGRDRARHVRRRPRRARRGGGRVPRRGRGRCVRGARVARPRGHRRQALQEPAPGRARAPGRGVAPGAQRVADRPRRPAVRQPDARGVTVDRALGALKLGVRRAHPRQAAAATARCSCARWPTTRRGAASASTSTRTRSRRHRPPPPSGSRAATCASRSATPPR